MNCLETIINKDCLKIRWMISNKWEIDYLMSILWDLNLHARTCIINTVHIFFGLSNRYLIRSFDASLFCPARLVWSDVTQCIWYAICFLVSLFVHDLNFVSETAKIPVKNLSGLQMKVVNKIPFRRGLYKIIITIASRIFRGLPYSEGVSEIQCSKVRLSIITSLVAYVYIPLGVD